MFTNSSKIVNRNGRLLLEVNNKIINTDSYICYFSNNNMYKEFTDIGYNFFYINVFFATRSINQFDENPPFMDGIFDSEKGFKAFDEEMDKVLQANPNALIIPRVNVSLPVSYDNEHEEELNDVGNLYKDTVRRPTFSSDNYYVEVKKHLKKFIEYVEGGKYNKNIIGFQISDGQTQEWMPFDYNGSQSKRSREKFAQLVKENKYQDNIYDYRQYLSDITAIRICELCSYVKELTKNRLVVGSFYGYSFVLAAWRFCHSALNIILNSDAVDFLASPLSYWTNRSLVEDNPRMNPVASMRLHGKLFIAENDTRTDLSRPPFDLPQYNNPIWLQFGRENSLNSIKMHYSIALCGGHAQWWFDMWGGWYQDPAFLSLMNKTKEISMSALNCSLKSLNEVAVITDELAFSHLEIDDEKENFDVLRNPLKEIGKACISYDGYLASDFESIKDTYKTFIILNKYETEGLKAIKNYLNSRKIKYLEITLKNHDIKASEIREFYKEAGLKPRFDFDTIIYENEDFLYIHTTHECDLVNPYNDIKLKPLFDSNTLPFHSEAGKGYLFKKLI